MRDMIKNVPIDSVFVADLKIKETGKMYPKRIVVSVPLECVGEDEFSFLELRTNQIKSAKHVAEMFYDVKSGFYYDNSEAGFSNFTGVTLLRLKSNYSNRISFNELLMLDEEYREEKERSMN